MSWKGEPGPSLEGTERKRVLHLIAEIEYALEDEQTVSVPDGENRKIPVDAYVLGSVKDALTRYAASLKSNRTKEEEQTKLSAPFLKIEDAAKVTGLSRFFIRKGCRDGSVPHIRMGEGSKILVNVPALLQQLNESNTRP